MTLITLRNGSFPLSPGYDCQIKNVSLEVEIQPVKIKIKLEKNGKLPVKAHNTDAGFDLYADIRNNDNGGTDEVIIYPHTTMKISAGFKMEIPDGYVGHIWARSGISTKQGLRPANCVGVVDSGYRGLITVALHNDSESIQHVQHGERIAQLTIDPVLPVNLIEADSLSDSDRGENGFGGSGKF